MNASPLPPQLSIFNVVRFNNTGNRSLDITAVWDLEHLYVGVPQANPQNSYLSIYHTAGLTWLNNLDQSYNKIGLDPRKLAMGPQYGLVCYTANQGSRFVNQNNGQGVQFTDKQAFAMGMSGNTLFLSNHQNNNLDVFTYNPQNPGFTAQPSIPDIGILSYIAVDQAAGRIYALRLGSNWLSCIQASTSKVLFQQTIPFYSFLICVGEKLGRLFVGGSANDTGIIQSFNSQTGQASPPSQPFSFSPNTQLSSIAFDEAAGTLLVGHNNGDPNAPRYFLSVFNPTAGGAALSRTPLVYNGQNFAATSIMVSPKGGTVIVSDYNTGTLALLKPAGPVPLPSLPSTGFIQSRAFPNACLRMDGQTGHVNCQNGHFAWESFAFQPQNDGTVAIMSQAFPGTYLYMMAFQKQNNPSGFGWVTGYKAPTPLPAQCKFLITTNPDNSYPGAQPFWTIESAAYPGVYLRMDAQYPGGSTPNGFGLVNCQFGHFPWEHFSIQSA